MEENLTIKEAYELNTLFRTNKFKPKMNSLNLYTSILSINFKHIAPGENNLRLIQSKKHIHRLIGTFVDNNRRLLHITCYSIDGVVVKELDFDCQRLYQDTGKQRGDIKDGRTIEFTKLIREIFVPRSRYFGFKIIYK